MKKHLIAVAIASLGTLPLGAHAGFAAITSALPTGNQLIGAADVALSLGRDFTVGVHDISVTAFGAYDSGNNGFTSPIRVGIFDNLTQSLVGGVFREFNSATSGTNLGGTNYWFIHLGADSFDLQAGHSYSIVAQGYGSPTFGLEQNGNTNFGSPDPGIDTGLDGSNVPLITFNNSRFTSATSALAYPTIADATGRYDAGSFIFEQVQQTNPAAVPLPGTLALSVFGAALFGARRRKAK